MSRVMVNSMIRNIKGVYTLIRTVPVLSWGISSSLVGLGSAYAYGAGIRWLDYVLIILFIITVHGVVSHAFNDREDWLSGTDQYSPGILSGGSGVISRGLYNTEQLATFGKNAVSLALIIAFVFLWRVGPGILFFLALALWSALAYTCPPLRLSYYPLTGEWLCGFPAVLACAVGTFYVLTGTIHPVVLVAGGIHSLLAIGLLMHHHLADIVGDLAASPRKLTTVALAALALGTNRSQLVGVAYFVLALVTGVIGGLFFHPVFWVTIPYALACAYVTLTTRPGNICDITVKEYCLYWLIIGDAVTKTVLLLLIGKG